MTIPKPGDVVRFLSATTGEFLYLTFEIPAGAEATVTQVQGRDVRIDYLGRSVWIPARLVEVVR